MKHKAMIIAAMFVLLIASGLFSQNNALYFDGVNDCVAIGNMNAYISTTFTVEAWINPASVAIGSGDLSTFGRTIFASSTSNDKPIWVTQRGSEIRVFSFNGNTQRFTTSGLGLTSDTWYHIAVTVVKGGALVLYVNGTAVQTSTAGSSGTNWNTTFTIGDLRPGRQIAFWGLIDEVRVWNYARTAGDILGNYDKVVDPSSAGLIGYWMLDESSGTNAADSSTPAFDGTVRDGTSVHPNPQWVDGNPTLPVELSSFAAILTADFFVKLHWTTQSETGVSGFYIYRGKENDIANAITVSPLIDATNTTDQHNYEYVDSELYEPGTYYYWLSVQNMDGSVDYHGPTTVYYDNSANHGAPGIPILSGLNSVYPNPFNPSTNIAYGLNKEADVNFIVYNSRGQIVRRISEGQKAAGNWKLTWNGLDDNGITCSTGVYYIKMNAGKDSFIKKAVLLK